MLRPILGLLLLLAGGCSCGDGAGALIVDLRTDLVPTVEFNAVRVEVFRGAGLEGAPEESRDAAVLRSDYFAGQRVAEIEPLAGGQRTLRVSLLDALGETVAARVTRLEVEGTVQVTVVITRDCRGVMCPQAGDAPAAISCLGGRCVPPECVVGDEEACPDAECAADEDCPVAAPCAQGRCDEGTCLAEPRSGGCGAAEYCDPDVGCRLLPVEDLDAGMDAGMDAGPVADAGPLDAGCRADDDCDDGVLCTADRCVSGRCTFTPEDAACTMCAGATCNAVFDCQCPDCNPTVCVPADGCETTRCVMMGAGEVCVHEDSCGTGFRCCGVRGTPEASCEQCCADADCPDDGNACNGVARCSAGTCTTTTPVACDDGIACTVDTCNPTSGACTSTPMDSLCTAGAGGRCVVAAGGCQYSSCTMATCTPDPCGTAVCMGELCMRSTLCSMAQMCCGGACVPLGCDDGNPCTDDSCGGSGCSHTPNAAPCSDGDMCTLGDRCSGGRCMATMDRSCDDANVCTDDRCDPMAGCSNAPNMAACDDGNGCTVGDSCAGGSCNAGAPMACFPDSNPCTLERCSPVTATCESVPHPAGTPCGPADTCPAETCDGAGTCLLGRRCGPCEECVGGTCQPVADGTRCSGGACWSGYCLDCSPCLMPNCVAPTGPPPGLGCDRGGGCDPCRDVGVGG